MKNMHDLLLLQTLKSCCWLGFLYKLFWLVFHFPFITQVPVTPPKNISSLIFVNHHRKSYVQLNTRSVRALPRLVKTFFSISRSNSDHLFLSSGFFVNNYWLEAFNSNSSGSKNHIQKFPRKTNKTFEIIFKDNLGVINYIYSIYKIMQMHLC